MIYTKASRVKVTSEDKVQLNVDGEYGGLLPAGTRKPVPPLEVFAPLDKIREEDRP